MGRHPIRISGENLHHHIFAWGNDRHPVFRSAYHFQKYLDLLESESTKFNVEVIAYALMEWHIHLFIFDQMNKISEFMENLHGKYAIFFNKETGRVGHVFGERYNNIIVQPNIYALWLTRYIHRQAVEAGIVNNPIDYPWTSYRQYIGLEPIKFIKPQIILEQFGDFSKNFRGVTQNYKDFVVNEQGETQIDWDDTRTKIIGDLDYTRALTKRLQIIGKPTIAKEIVLKELSRKLNCTVDQLLTPKGIDEKRRRREAVNILAKEYEMKIIDIARLLKLSRFTVMKIID